MNSTMALFSNMRSFLVDEDPQIRWRTISKIGTQFVYSICVKTCSLGFFNTFKMVFALQKKADNGFLDEEQNSFSATSWTPRYLHSEIVILCHVIFFSVCLWYNFQDKNIDKDILLKWQKCAWLRYQYARVCIDMWKWWSSPSFS